MKRPITAEEADKRNQEILEGWNTKQPWPRSAKITVWVLGVLLVASLVTGFMLYSGLMDTAYDPNVANPCDIIY